MNPYFFAYLFALLLASTNGISASYIGLSSYEIVFLRFWLATPMLLLIFLIAQKGRFTFFRYKRSCVFLLISGLSLAGNVLFLFEAYDTIGVSLGILANYLGPVIVMLLSPVLFHERLTLGKLGGLVVVLIGVVLVNGQVFLEGASSWGLFCGGMAAVCLASMNICNKFAQDIKGLENSLLMFAIATIAITVFVGSRQSLVIIPASSDWLPLLFLGLISTGIGNNLYFVAGKRLPAQTIAICGYFEPVLAVFLSAVILHEVMTPSQLLGAAFILGGAMFCERKPKDIAAADSL